MKNLTKKDFPMKSKTIIQSLVLASAILWVPGQAEGGYPVYPPFTEEAKNYLVFPDSDNEALMKNCTNSERICARFYVLPQTINLATNDETGVKMLTQGIFPRRSRLDHQVVYNLTLEPDLENMRDIRDSIRRSYVTERAQRYGQPLKDHQIVVAALPVAEMQLIATGLDLMARNDGEVEDEIEEELDEADEVANNEEGVPELTEEQIAKITHEIINNVSYTRFYAPTRNGDLQSLGSRFSVSIQGKAWELEPSFQNMFLSEGGNAVIGTVSFKFRVQAAPLKVNMSCNLKTFQEVMRNTRKTWDIYRYTSRRKTIERFRNDEWNVVKNKLKIEDFCKITRFDDTTIAKTEVMATLEDLIFSKLFDRAFDAVTTRDKPKTEAGSDPKYTTYEYRAIDEAETTFDVNLEETQVIWLSSDVDFQAGNIERDQLDPLNWALCYPWQRPDPGSRVCQEVCAPMAEVYWPAHPDAIEPGEWAQNKFGITDKVCVSNQDFYKEQ